jgi:diaminopimelate epimerase
MHGIGNDFVMIDQLTEHRALDWGSVARQVCDRRSGVGADGLILALPGQRVPFRMQMFNPDGSESEMCGNGIRCFARFVQDLGATTDSKLEIETAAGLLRTEVLPDGRVRVDMGPARVTRGEIGMIGAPRERFLDAPLGPEGLNLTGTAISMGNPHLVVLSDDVRSVPLAEWGPILEHHPLFPNRVNVHFAQTLDRQHILQRTWERGAGATLACGTGACAVAVAAFLLGKTEREVTIRLPGGELDIHYREDGRVMMTGAAETSFTGAWAPDESD